MNQVEMAVMMKRHYVAKWVAAVNAFRFHRNDRIFELSAAHKTGNSAECGTIERLYFRERILPDCDFGKVKNKLLASLDTPPKDMNEVKKWINKQLIAAFLDEHCES